MKKLVVIVLAMVILAVAFTAIKADAACPPDPPAAYRYYLSMVMVGRPLHRGICDIYIPDCHDTFPLP